MPSTYFANVPRLCRSPQGERGLKSAEIIQPVLAELGRSPQGERGLKFESHEIVCVVNHVALRKESVD